MDLNLVYLGNAFVGGWVTYTAHLARGLQMMGHNVALYCLRNTSGYCRRFGYGVRYIAATEGDMTQLPKRAPTIIAAASRQMLALAIRMLQHGAILVIHDASEARRLLRSWNVTRYPLIVDRLVVRRYLPHAYFVPQCYIKANGDWPEWQQRQEWAISLARIDFDKYTEFILEANSGLPCELQVVLFGGENRVYGRELHRHWPDLFKQRDRKLYSQHDPSIAVRTAAQYRFMVDMSAIYGDGGGTQYTFFEGANAGCVLILNRRWVQCDGMLDLGDSICAEMVPGVNCLAVSNGEELRQLLLDCHKRKDNAEFIQQMHRLLQGGEDLLRNHGPEIVIPKLISCIKEIYARSSWSTK
jgi:hypothetical protein